jgi:hypothetical protein
MVQCAFSLGSAPTWSSTGYGFPTQQDVFDLPGNN